jgi:hypothetical protein
MHVMTFFIDILRFVALSSAAALISQAVNRLLAYLTRPIRGAQLASGGVGKGPQLGDAPVSKAQANAATCTSTSLIGETTVSVGVGGDPFTVTDGKVYLTGPYEGAPFGLSVVTPAVAGPFNLGNIISRAKIYINFLTHQVFLTPNPFPQIIDAIPLQIKHVNKNINRPAFTFNPTNCNRLQTIASNGLK